MILFDNSTLIALAAASQASRMGSDCSAKLGSGAPEISDFPFEYSK
jgi:hypothetical protein